MEVFEALRTRASVRDFLPAPIPAEALEKLKEAALCAPTSLNLQQQRFCFITAPDILRALTEGVIRVSEERGETDYLERLAQRDGKVFFGAPLVIVIAVNPENNYIDVDAGIAVQSLALAAKALGLDSVIMAAPDRVFTGPRAQEYERLLGFPAGYRFAIALAVGYAACEFRPHEHKQENMIELC